MSGDHAKKEMVTGEKPVTSHGKAPSRESTQVQLIHGDPRYKLMSPEEVIGKFVSFELMIKGSKKIIEQGTSSSVPEAQPVAFKAAAVVAPSFPGVSPLVPGATPVVYLLFPDASPGVLAASEHAYQP
jgi:hypothetical protein